MDQSSYMPVTPVLPGDMEGLRLVGIDAKRVTHPLFVIVKPRKRDSDGRLLVVEYKGEHLVAGELEKRQVGEVWAKSSGGKCLFMMAVKKDEAGRDVSAQLDAVIGGS